MNSDVYVSRSSSLKVYTKGRPPWFDCAGKRLKKSYIIGICGGSASGKTTVAQSIIERLEMPWVTVLSMDSFYKVLSDEQHEQAARQQYNFDHPDAFDFDLLYEALVRLRDGKSVEVPVYDFTTHSRDKNPKLMYGADVLIFEGILSFHKKCIADLMDMKVFVETDSDICLARRLERDISERGRDVTGILEQYLHFVKPAFDSFIAPGMKEADIIVPRGGENNVAIDLIVRQIKSQLAARGYDTLKNSHWRQELANTDVPFQRPQSLHIIKETPQIRGIHTIIRDRNTSRDEFIFYAERLMCLLIEEALNYVPYANVEVETPTGQKYNGCRKCSNICGVSIMRAGDTLAKSLRSVIRDCKMGKILIQTNELTKEPELHYLRMPKNIKQYKVFLMDATVATGAAAMMAIRILLEHDVREENIILLSLLMAETGIHQLAYAFPRVTLVTTAVDPHINEQYYVIPGLGNFGDRYYGSEAVGMASTDDELDEEQKGACLQCYKSVQQSSDYGTPCKSDSGSDQEVFISFSEKNLEKENTKNKRLSDCSIAREKQSQSTNKNMKIALSGENDYVISTYASAAMNGEEKAGLEKRAKKSAPCSPSPPVKKGISAPVTSANSTSTSSKCLSTNGAAARRIKT